MFIVIIGQVVGNPEAGYSTVWTSDMEEKRTLRAAKSHGFRTRGSDDFRIGRVRYQTLKELSWMGEKFFKGEELWDTADQLGLRNDHDSPDDGCGIGWGN